MIDKHNRSAARWRLLPNTLCAARITLGIVPGAIRTLVPLAG